MKPIVSFLSFLAIVLCSVPSAAAQSASTISVHRESDIISAKVLSLSPKASRAFDKGTRLLLKGDTAASVPYFLTVIELAPDNYAPYHNLALAHYNLGHFDEAAENFRKAVDLSKASFAPSLFGLCMVEYRRAKYEDAETLAHQGLSLTPSSAVGTYYLGLVQYSRRRTSDAQHSARDALRLNPKLADVHLLLAHISERLRNPQGVLNEVEEYFKLTTNTELAADALALRERAEKNLAHVSLLRLTTDGGSVSDQTRQIQEPK